MSIPNYPALMRPLLEHLSDGSEHKSDEILNALADGAQLSEEERTRLLPKGKLRVFKNRVAWAKAKLNGAGLIERSQPDAYRISPSGSSVLSKTDGPLTNQDLANLDGPSAAEPPVESMTPEELIEQAFGQIRKKLAADLLVQIKNRDPEFFEELVAELFGTIYKIDVLKVVVTGKTGDGGIDVKLHQDPLGLDTIYLQAKRWEGSVGRPEIMKFHGALAGQKGKRGIFVTTSFFTKDAQDFANSTESKIILIDGPRLADLMIEYEVGVKRDKKYGIVQIDGGYFLSEEG